MATSWGFDSNRTGGNLLAGGISTIFNPALGGYLSSYESRMAQEQALQQQHEWQVAENEKDREFQRNLWREQYEASNDYAYLAKRLQDAGINPSAYFGSGSAAPASPAGSAPARSSSPYGFAGASYNGGGQGVFSTVAQMMDSLTRIRTQNQSEERQKATLSAEVDKLLADASSANANAEFIDTQNQIKKALGYSRESAEILRLNNEAYAAAARGDYDKAAELNQLAMSKLNDAKQLTEETLRPVLLSNQKKLGDVYVSERQKNVAQTSQAYASALREKSQSNYFDSLSATENALRDGRVTAQRLSNDLSDIQRFIANTDKKVVAATWRDRLSAVVAEYERNMLINKEMEQQIRKMMTDNDWNGVEHALGAISSAVGSLTNLGNLELNQWSTAQRLQIQSRAVENMRKPRYVTNSRYDSRGNLQGSEETNYYY